MNVQEEFNKLLEMDLDERKKAIKNMTKEQRNNIIELMALPKNCSQKSLCSEIEETKLFIKIARND